MKYHLRWHHQLLAILRYGYPPNEDLDFQGKHNVVPLDDGDVTPTSAPVHAACVDLSIYKHCENILNLNCSIANNMNLFDHIVNNTVIEHCYDINYYQEHFWYLLTIILYFCLQYILNYYNAYYNIVNNIVYIENSIVYNANNIVNNIVFYVK